MGGTTWAGIHSPALLVLLCGDGTSGCHGWIESNRSAALRLGWLLSRHMFGIDPADVPLRWDDRPDRLYLRHDGITVTEWTGIDTDRPNAPTQPIEENPTP